MILLMIASHYSGADKVCLNYCNNNHCLYILHVQAKQGLWAVFLHVLVDLVETV